jgi:hypothetical protein
MSEPLAVINTIEAFTCQTISPPIVLLVAEPAVVK